MQMGKHLYTADRIRRVRDLQTLRETNMLMSIMFSFRDEREVRDEHISLARPVVADSLGDQT